MGLFKSISIVMKSVYILCFIIGCSASSILPPHVRESPSSIGICSECGWIIIGMNGISAVSG